MSPPNIIRTLVPAFALAVMHVHAQAPAEIVNHQGRILVGSTNFNGTGQFRFALVDAIGDPFWRNAPDAAPVDGIPDASVAVTVTNGLYSVLLGDTAIPNMAALTPGIFGNADIRLRVWFDDGVNGLQLLTPDQRLAPAGAALFAKQVPGGSITAFEIADGSITGGELAAGNIQTQHLADGTVTNPKLADSSVSSAKLSNNAVTAAKLGNGAVGSAQLAPEAVGSTNIQDSAVTSAKLAAGSVGSLQVANESLTGIEIVDGTITSADIETNTVSSHDIEDGTLQPIDFANNAVTTAKIADGAVATAKIASGAVTSAELAIGAVTSDRLADGSVLNQIIADSAVTTSKILDGSIKSADLSPNLQIGTSSAEGSLQIFRQVTPFVSQSLLCQANSIVASEESNPALLSLNQNGGDIHLGNSNSRVSIGAVSPNNDTGLIVTNGSGSSTTNGGGTVVVGNRASLHLALDPDDFGAYNNNTPTLLDLNYYGGNVRLNGGGSGGFTGIGRNPSANRLEVEGDASKTTAGDWAANSDRRIKRDIRPVTGALETLERVRPVIFKYTEQYRAAHPSIADADYYNVIAQEFREVFPDAVKGSGEHLPDGSEILQVDTYPATITTIAAVKELHAETRALRAENAELRRRLAAIEAAVGIKSTATGGVQ